LKIVNINFPNLVIQASLVSKFIFPTCLRYCWVHVASSTWNALWSWNTNKGRLQKQVQKATWKFVDNLIE